MGVPGIPMSQSYSMADFSYVCALHIMNNDRLISSTCTDNTDYDHIMPKLTSNLNPNSYQLTRLVISGCVVGHRNISILLLLSVRYIYILLSSDTNTVLFAYNFDVPTNTSPWDKVIRAQSTTGPAYGEI